MKKKMSELKCRQKERGCCVCVFLSPFLKRSSHLNARELILSSILIICYKKCVRVYGWALSFHDNKILI